MDYEDIKTQCLNFFEKVLLPCNVSLRNGTLEYLKIIPSEHFCLKDSDFVVSDVDRENQERIFIANNDTSYNLARVMMMIKYLIEHDKASELKERGLLRDYHLNVFPINVPNGSLGMRYRNVPNTVPHHIFVIFNSKKESWCVYDYICAGG